MSGELTAKYLAWVGQCFVCVAADFSLTELGADGVEAIALRDWQALAKRHEVRRLPNKIG